VLGAGGFIPHSAAEVLSNKFGDCKDHVILLQALLAAKDIDSSAVLISADARYTIPRAASPFAFNHLITYIPKLRLYLDSTARYAPFGTLPFADSDKPVVRIKSLDTARTPNVSAETASIKSVETVTISSDGSIDGVTNVTAKGSATVDMRNLMELARSMGDAEYLHRAMGPGVQGSIERGDSTNLADVYTLSVKYRLPNALNIPGPAAIPPAIAYKPFSLTLLAAGDLPEVRTVPYVCPSMDADEDLTFHLPGNLQVLSLPRGTKVTADGVALEMSFDQPVANVLHANFRVRVDHKGATCSPEYYATVRTALAQIASALRTEILYK